LSYQKQISMTTKIANVQKDFKGYQVTVNEFTDGMFSNCYTLFRNITKSKAENVAKSYNKNFEAHKQLHLI